MSDPRLVVHWCPLCGSAIRQDNVLIEYETTDGTDMFAECPDCKHVVHPIADDDRR